MPSVPLEDFLTAVDPERKPASGFLPKWLIWLVLALALGASVGVRLRLRDFPLERDEGEYAYAGQLILQGIPPYELAYNMKLPGTYLAYAGMMTVFGQTIAGVHLGLLVVHLATLALLYLLARRFYSESGATIAVAAYALMSLSPSFLGLAAHATHFVVLPALGGFLLLLRNENERRPIECLLAGVLFGLAFIMKQQGVFFGIFGGLYLVHLQIRKKPDSWPLVAVRLLCFAGGCIAPFLLVCFWLAFSGVFGNFWLWTFSYARQYASVLSLSDGLGAFCTTGDSIFWAAPLLWLLAAFGLAVVIFSSMPLHRRLFLLGFFVFSFLAVCPGFYFRNHYFILLLPAAVILIGAGVSWTEALLAETRDGAQARYLPLVLAAFACAQSLYHDREVFFFLSPAAACQAVYMGNPFVESIAIAKYLQEHTKKDDSIAVLGSEPQIYFYAHRHSATGYIYTYPLMEPQPYAEYMQKKMISEIGERKPKYLVFVSTPLSWLARPTSLPYILDWAREETTKHCVADGIMPLTGAKDPQGVWGPAAGSTPLRSSYFVALFKEKTQE